jgi:hypothetical protein
MRLLAAALGALATLLATAGAARAEDECETDEDCVALYADDFTCVSGSLGRYCLERGCETDDDCEEEYGDDAWCEHWGSEGRCAVPEPPPYVPPFRSICSAVPGRPAQPGLWAVVPIGAACGLLRARARRGW